MRTRYALLLASFVACRSEPPPPAPAPSAAHVFPPSDPRLEPDVPHLSAETATLVSESNLIPVLPTAASVEQLLVVTRAALAGDAGTDAIGDFALSAHAAPTAVGTEVKVVASGPEWYQISVQIDGRWMKGFVPRFMVKRAPYEAPYDVAIGDLLSGYKANELRADGSYKGKLIRTFGTVGQVGKGIGGEPFVTIGTGARFEIPSVQCFLADPADPEALALSAGGKATVQGRVDRLLGNVMVKDCMVNPLAHLCRRMIDATGGKRCEANKESGDGNAIVFEEDAKHDAPVFGLLSCSGTPTSGSASLPDLYAITVEFWSKRQPTTLLIGSPRTACYAMLYAPKGATFPEPLRDKVQAFFDAL